MISPLEANESEPKGNQVKQLTNVQLSLPLSDSSVLPSELVVQQRQEMGLEQISWLQRKLDHLHEELYRRGGIKPANAAIDELGKLIFLRIHAEKDPQYVLSTGRGKGLLFTDLFNASYVQRLQAKAVGQLQDAFEEISTLPRYVAITEDNTPQTIFAYKEALRLNQPDVLAQAIATLNSIRLFSDESQTDVLGLVYDVFLRGKYDSAGGLGTHLTPTPIVQAMVEMAFKHILDAQLWQNRFDKENKQELPTFLMGDICCGTGRFITAVMNKVRERLLAKERDPNTEAQWRLLRRHSFLGADQAESSIVKARINMLMYGEDHSHLITAEDSITDQRIDKMAGQFDLILTNPPFGSGKYVSPAGLEKMRDRVQGYALGWSWQRDGSKKKALTRVDPAILFIDRNLGLLKPGGILGIVLPDGLLGPAYGYVHDYLFGKLDLETGKRSGGKAILLAVVSLSKETFAISGTVAKTSFILLQKQGPETPPQRSVFVAVAEHVGFLKKGTVEVPDPQGNDLLEIACQYMAFVPDDAQEIQEIFKTPQISTVPHTRFVNTLVAQAFSADRQHANMSIRLLGNQSRRLGDLARLDKKKSQQWSEETEFFISVLHIDEHATIDWVAAASHRPQTAGTQCRPGDVIFSCINPRKSRVAVIPEDVAGEVLCSTEFAVLRPKPGINPYLLVLALRTDLVRRQIVPLARGTSSSRRRVNPRDLLSIYVPYLEEERQMTLAEQFRRATEMTRQAARMNTQALTEFETDLELGSE
jgi:type I restriction enzyme M protein